MQRLLERKSRNEPWSCTRCYRFQALTLRILMRHYNIIHGNEPNFRVVCSIDGCPATFNLYDSFYRHVKRRHKELYDENLKACEENAEDENQRESANEDENESVDVSTSDDDSENTSRSDNVEEEQQDKVAMGSILDSTRTLVRQVVDSLKSDVLAAFQSDNQKEEVENLFQCAQDPFTGIDTEALQSTYIKKHFHYVGHKEITLGKILSRKKKGSKRIIYEKEEKFIYIPLVDSVQQMLSNERIAGMILKNPHNCYDGVFYDMHDGSVYKNDKYFQEHENPLPLVIYHDELEVCNPLGSNAGTHKVDMFYYTIANISPKFRSKRCAVRLLAIANAAIVKKYGINAVMKHIVDDLQLLYRGVGMNVNGTERVIHGKVLMCTGDTLGQHYWGGFKEGVGASFQKCRHCQCEFQQMQTDLSVFMSYSWLKLEHGVFPYHFIYVRSC